MSSQDTDKTPIANVKPAIEHTPTPWKVKAGHWIDGPRGAFVAMVEDSIAGGANAAHIVRAVNAHDALVAFVERAPCHCDGPSAMPDGPCARCAALALAKGTP